MHTNQIEWKNNDLFYYNATLACTATVPIQAIVSDNRNVPFIWNPSEWQVAVERFDISSQGVPFFNYNPTANPLIVTVAVVANNTYESFTLLAPNYNNNTQAQWPSNGIFSINQFITMINQSIYDCCVALGSAYLSVTINGVVNNST